MTEGKVLVVGAGPAGTRAAETLVAHGVAPIVVDEGARSGGQIYRRPPEGFKRPAAALYGFEARKAEAVHGALDGLRERIDYRPGTLIWNIEGGVALALGPEGVERIAFDALILATGAMDRVIPFPGWTLPGVFTMGGSQVALKAQGCAIGDPVVFMGTGPLLYLVAYQYVHAGARVA
ncbi:MAG: FAD/NAD(P)-binding oxidoreductase, partial [Rhodospirillaceae bacterium]|nr:FAD/NAD(P)-binding oxidoreductase [Rhodospirillaceae bacterium]